MFMILICCFVLVFAFVVLALRDNRDRNMKKNFERYMQPKLEFKVVPASTTNKSARTIMLTGGNGFVGKCMVSQLIEKNLNVIVFDVMLPPEHLRSVHVTYVQGNLLNENHLSRVFQLHKTLGSEWKVHSVIHVAALIPYLGVPEEAIFAVNVHGTDKLLKLSASQEVKSFIYTSSATVVLERHSYVADKVTEGLPFPVEHMDIYTKSKSIAERLVVAANSPHGMVTSILRPAAVFGKGECVIYLQSTRQVRCISSNEV